MCYNKISIHLVVPVWSVLPVWSKLLYSDRFMGSGKGKENWEAVKIFDLCLGGGTLEQLKRQYERVQQYINKIQEKLTQGMFLSSEDCTGIQEELDALCNEQARVQKMVEGDSAPHDIVMSVQAAEEFLTRNRERERYIARLRQITDEFQAIRSLEIAYQSELSKYQKQLADIDDTKLQEMDRRGELEPYRAFLACVKQEKAAYEDVKPLVSWFGTSLPLGIMGKELVLPAQEEPNAKEKPDAEEKKPPVLPPLSDLSQMGNLRRGSGVKPFKGKHVLERQMRKNPKIRWVIQDLRSMPFRYFISPENPFCTQEKRAEYKKCLSLLQAEGYLSRYTLDIRPGQVLYGFAQGMSFGKRDPINDSKTVRMETAADFIRCYEERRWFSKTFIKNDPIHAFGFETTGACFGGIAQEKGGPLSCLILPAAIFTQEDPEDALLELGDGL